MSERNATVAAAPGRDFGEVIVRLRPHLNELDEFLRSQLGAFEPDIRHMVAYCLDASGKRIRPALASK